MSGTDVLSQLPWPPLEFRRLVGPTELDQFDNPTGQLVFKDLPEEACDYVLDFGCGCGRLARQLIQQRPRPRRYLGIDPHRGMIEWCQTNLSPHAPEFVFWHHDVFQQFMNPGGSLNPIPLAARDSEITLFIGWSVFTHLLEADAKFYLGEMARVLSPVGTAVTTWLLFDKRDFPMMQTFQNALFISDFDPTNAVIFDRRWLSSEASRAGLVMSRIVPPAIRGFQWRIHFQKLGEGRHSEAFPEDTAPRGIARPSLE